MEKRTIVLTTYGKTREHLHGECIDIVKHQHGILVLETRAMDIETARSLLACSALAHGADVAVFIDSDVLFDPDDVELLAESARETEGVVGGIYARRKMGAGLASSFSPDAKEATFFEGGGRYAAAGVVAMGFTAIHRSVFEKLDALPEYTEVNSLEGLMRPYFKRIVRDGYWHKEDASFCHVARDVGKSTHVDTRFRLKHLGDHPFGVEDSRLSRQSVDEPTIKMQLRPKH